MAQIVQYGSELHLEEWNVSRYKVSHFLIYDRKIFASEGLIFKWIKTYDFQPSRLCTHLFIYSSIQLGQEGFLKWMDWGGADFASPPYVVEGW